MYDEIRQIRKQMVDNLFVRSAKKNICFLNLIVFVPFLASCNEQFPLAVQIIFQKKQML